MFDSKQEIRWILSQLRTELCQRGFTQRDVQRRLGWGKNFLGELFSGKKRLQWRQLVAILEVIGANPAAFYARLYRWPLVGASSEDRRPDGQPPSAEAVRARGEGDVGRLQASLRRRIEASELTQLAIERRLRWGGGYVSRLLKAGSSPRLDQVLAILGALGVEPEELFAELYAPEMDPELPADLGTDEICWALLEKGLLTARDVAAARKQRRLGGGRPAGSAAGSPARPPSAGSR